MVIAIRPRILQACQLQIRWKENSVQILAISSKNPEKVPRTGPIGCMFEQ
jgi:hypothetical protein